HVPVGAPQRGRLLQRGGAYAEEYPISRYVADAQVLPIFEGVKPILALKVVGRSLIGRSQPRTARLTQPRVLIYFSRGYDGLHAQVPCVAMGSRAVGGGVFW